MTLSPLLTGKKVRLTSVQEADLKIINQWYQDTEFMRLFDGTPARPRTQEQTKKWFETDMQADNNYYFAIRPTMNDDIIGIVDISSIMWNHGTGWLAIAIGDDTLRGQGYGTEAMELVLDFAFRELNLHRIQLTVFEYNTAAIALYEKLGFTREGAHREFLHRDGKRYDMILFGILRHEWEGRAG